MEGVWVRTCAFWGRRNLHTHASGAAAAVGSAHPCKNGPGYEHCLLQQGGSCKFTNCGIAGGMGSMQKGRNRIAHIGNIFRGISGLRCGRTCLHSGSNTAGGGGLNRCEETQRTWWCANMIALYPHATTTTMTATRTQHIVQQQEQPSTWIRGLQYFLFRSNASEKTPRPPKQKGLAQRASNASGGKQ